MEGTSGLRKPRTREMTGETNPAGGTYCRKANALIVHSGVNVWNYARNTFRLEGMQSQGPVEPPDGLGMTDLDGFTGPGQKNTRVGFGMESGSISMRTPHSTGYPNSTSRIR
jgi:hypothetical protein